MTIRNLSDQGFDDFRKARKRMQARLGPTNSANANYENAALRELEQAEQREAQDQRLTRDVHDFFAAATRQAAAIVEKVAKDALQETGERVEAEMEAFLIDALARMNTFILKVLKEKRGPIAETAVEPSIGNLVGKTLDAFRSAGTADMLDKHIGQDPFETPVDDVQRELRRSLGSAAGPAEPASVPIDEHLVAAVQEEESAPDSEQPDEPAAAASDEAEEALPPPPAPVSRTTAAREPAAVAAAKAAPAAAPTNDLDRFKEALKALVRQGTMTRDEARIAWQTRLQSIGQGR